MPNKYLGQTGTPANANLDTLPQLPGVLGALPAAVVAALQQFAIMAVVANAAARDALIPAPYLHQRVLNLATSRMERWTGAAWVQDVPLPAAKEADGLPVVADVVDRAVKFPAPANGQRAHNEASGQFERYVAQGTTAAWFADTERPSEFVNPRKFALGAWYDANGIITIGMNREDYLTPAEIAIIQALPCRGHYNAYVDTRDYYCCMEAILEAWAPTSVNGNIQFNIGTPRGILIPPGLYNINRPLWSSQISGGHLIGHGAAHTVIRNFMPGSRTYWTDGMTSCGIRHLGFDHISLRSENSFNNFWQPILDLDWFTSNGGPTGAVPPNVAFDPTVRHVTGFASPSIKRAGSGWTVNQFAGQMLVIIDDTGNTQAVGQAIRIRENSSDTLYLDGRWSWIPSATAKFVIAPKKYGWARWHGHNWMTDYDPTTNFNTSGVVNGDTLYRFHKTNKFDGLAEPQLLTVVVNAVNAAGKTITLTADWPTWAAGSAPYPSTANQTPEANAQFELPAPEHDLCNYVVGGTFFDNNGGANVITGNNDTYIDLDSSPGAINSKIGGYCQFIGSAAGFAGVASASDGINITVNGVSRGNGADNLKYLMVTSGGGAGLRRLIKSTTVAGGNTTWNCPDGTGIVAGDSFQIVDASVLGTILPIALMPTLTRLQFNYEPGGNRQRYLFSKNPSIGDSINILASNRGTAFTHNYFLQVEPQASDGKSALLVGWARSGDGSMGSEAIFEDCSVNAPRTGFYVAGLNAINIYWIGGQGGAPQHTFFVEKGWINIRGTGFGGGTPYNMQKKGFDVCVDTSSSNRRTKFSELDSETGLLIVCSQPSVIDDCTVAAGINGFGLNANHTWVEGDLYRPTTYSYGRQYMCVAVFGTFKTDAIAEAGFNWDSQLIQAIDGGGNGAYFLRMDPYAISTSSPDTVLVGGNYAGGIYNSQGGPTVVGGTWSRPDWLNNNGGARSIQIGMGANVFGTKVVPTLFDGNYAGPNPMPYHVVFQYPLFQGVNRYMHASPALHCGPIIMLVGDNGTPYQFGFAPFVPSQCDGVTQLLALLEDGSQAIPRNSVVWGKPPASGVDQPGREHVIAGGMATGAGAGGGVRFKSGASGGAAGATVRGLLDAMLLDSLQRTQRFGGVIKKAVVGTIGIAAAGNATPNPAGAELYRYSCAGNATINAPLNPAEGEALTLEILNNTAGAIAITLDPAFMGTFPNPGAGKWRSQRYAYDATLAKWKPQSAQSGDF